VMEDQSIGVGGKGRLTRDNLPIREWSEEIRGKDKPTREEDGREWEMGWRVERGMGRKRVIREE
jgi:hypothetical protein